MRKRVLIADDTTLMREMIRGALPAEDYQIVGEATSGDKAIELYQETKPDVMILDINWKLLHFKTTRKRIGAMFSEKNTVNNLISGFA